LKVSSPSAGECCGGGGCFWLAERDGASLDEPFREAGLALTRSSSSELSLPDEEEEEEEDDEELESTSSVALAFLPFVLFWRVDDAEAGATGAEALDKEDR
jgi:hypothetical protein